MNTYDSSPAAAAWAATAFARLPVEAHAIVWKPSSRARASATDTTRSLNECVGLAASFLIHTSRRPSRSASRSARSSGVQPAGSVPCGGRLTGQEVAVAPQRVRSGLDPAPQRGGIGVRRAARTRPRAGRSTARRRTARRAGRWSCIPCSEETLAAYVKKPPPGSVVGGPRNRPIHISQACRWSLMELAPFPCGRLPGFRRAISLHPSGCVLLCAAAV